MPNTSSKVPVWRRWWKSAHRGLRRELFVFLCWKPRHPQVILDCPCAWISLRHATLIQTGGYPHSISSDLSCLLACHPRASRCSSRQPLSQSVGCIEQRSRSLFSLLTWRLASPRCVMMFGSQSWHFSLLWLCCVQDWTRRPQSEPVWAQRDPFNNQREVSKVAQVSFQN